MQEVSNKSRQNSDSRIEGETGASETSFGWSTNFEHHFIEGNSKDFNLKLIKSVNKKYSLLNFLSNLKVKFDILYSASGWTHRAPCPFTDHNDNTPSFFYNSIENIFKCHGCGRAGGIVEFISFYKNRKKVQVATELLSQSDQFEDFYEEYQHEYNDRVDDLLLSFSNSIHKLLTSRKNDSKYIKTVEDILWSLDIYIEKSLPSQINSDSLEARLDKILEHIKTYE